MTNYGFTLKLSVGEFCCYSYFDIVKTIPNKEIIFRPMTKEATRRLYFYNPETSALIKIFSSVRVGLV